MPKASLAKSESQYGVHPGVAMMVKWVAELKEKTGRSVGDDVKKWLKTAYDLGT
jgi:hypothetical protein